MTAYRLAVIAALVATGAPSPALAQTVAFTGATVWDGTGSPQLRGATIVVTDGRIERVSQDPAPDGARVVRLDGSYVVPGFIDAHAHVSGLWAPDTTGTEADRARQDLELFAAYGVTTVNSLGDTPGVVALRHSVGPTDARARLLASGPVVTAASPQAAAAAARANAEAGADWLKLRVDDNLGTASKMPWDAVQAVLDVGAETGIPVATHLFYLADAKRLLEMGSGMIAHSVRDAPVDADFIAAMREKGVCYVPTLTRELSTFVYGARPAFFDDSFFLEYANEVQVKRVADPAAMARVRGSRTAEGYRTALAQAERNLAALSEAGIAIAFGTDAGPAGRFPGYFEHVELAMMVGAGLTPEQALTSATRTAASCLSRTDIGTLEPGKWADFLVLAADPLRDITHTKTLEQVYIAGARVR